MERRIIAAVLAVLLVTTAGCSFLGGQATDTPTESTASTATPTATQAPYAYPDGYDESGVTDSETAVDSHQRAVTDADSYTMTYTATVETPNRTLTIDFDQRANLVDERALVSSNVSSESQAYGSTTQYYTSDTVYVRSQYPGTNQTEYSNTSRAFNATRFDGLEFVRPLLTDVRYGPAETVDHDGETVAKYEAESLEKASNILGSQVSEENVTEFSATVLVSEDGVVRQIEYSATIQRGGETRSVTATFEVSAVGETTVPRPDWVDEA